jgi:hypothetical protein
MTITREMADACLWLSKSGTLSFDEDYLRHLSSSLSPADAVALHTFFHDESERHESEWRDDFLAMLPQAAGLLPPVDEAEFWQEQLYALIQAGDLSAVRAFITRIGIADQTFDPVKTYEECARMGQRDTLSFLPIDFYPIQGGDEHGQTAVALARELGHGEMADYFESIIAQLDARYQAAYTEGRARG